MKLTRFFHLNTVALFIIVLGGLFLSACGSTSSTGGGTGSTSGGSASCGSPPKLTKSTGLKVGFSQNISNSPWRLAENKSMSDGASAAG